MSYKAEDGTIQCWLEERCELGHAWGLGCKVCRWHRAASAWGRGDVRGKNNTRLTNLCRHGGHVPRATGACGHRRHAAALAALQAQAAPPEVNPLACPEVDALPKVSPPKDRRDVPGRAFCITAYKNAKAGAAFTMYTADIANSRASGASLPRNRESRITAQRITDCAAAVLRDDDRELFRACTDIALTMDGRKSRVVVRARLCMGSSLPERFRSEGAPRLANMFGESIRVVDRLVSFRENTPFSTTEELAGHLAQALQDVCGDDTDLYDSVRRKVRVFTPDGAADEQLAGRLSSDVFPHMCVVLRCATHALNGALRAGWAAEPTAHKVTKEIVQEVAKFVRTSERFAMNLAAKASQGFVAELENFSFAPQRFASRERPLSRFVVYGAAVMEALSIEVDLPTSRERGTWAARILRQLSGEVWCLIGMLADLSADCGRFVRRLDSRRLDPVQAAVVLEEFRDMLKFEYVRGDMWKRMTGTLIARVMRMLAAKQVLRFGGEYIVVQKPAEHTAVACQARVANIARAIMAYLRAQFPAFGTQALFRCFHLRGEERRAEDLRKLLGILGWGDGDTCACLAEYMFAWPLALAAKRDRSLDDREAWSQVALEVHPQTAAGHLKRVVCTMLAFLVTETEAERTFALERHQAAKRPKLGMLARFAGLKIMCDGLAIEALADPEVNPQGRFWVAVQRKYAAKYGTRFLGDLKTRKDKGQKRAEGRKRKGKETLTSVMRVRAQVIQAPLDAGHVSVFGYVHTPIRTIRDLRVATEAPAFRRVLDRAKKKIERQRADHEEARAAGRRLCVLPIAKKHAVAAACAKRRARAAGSGIIGQTRMSWRSIKRCAGNADPWVFVFDLGARPEGFMDRLYGGEPLRNIVARDIEDWMTRTVNPSRRIALVSRIESLPWPVLLATMIFGAHVREDLQTPMVRYSMLGRCVVAFTADFARAHREVMQVARIATRMTYRVGLQNASGRGRGQEAQAPFLCRRLAEVLDEIRQHARRQRARAQQEERHRREVKPRWHGEISIIYNGDADTAVAGLPPAAKPVARTLPEFIARFGRVIPT